MGKLARLHIDRVVERLVVEEALLEAEPVQAPHGRDAAKAWEARLKARRASIRLGFSELTQLLAVEHYASVGEEEEPRS